MGIQIQTPGLVLGQIYNLQYCKKNYCNFNQPLHHLQEAAVLSDPWNIFTENSQIGRTLAELPNTESAPQAVPPLRCYNHD